MRIALALILMTFTSTSVKGQAFIGDSLSCYSKEELYTIVVKLAQGSECDTLLKIERIQSANKDTIIRNDSIQKRSQAQAMFIKDLQLEHRDGTIKGLESQVKKTQLWWGLTLLAVLAAAILN